MRFTQAIELKCDVSASKDGRARVLCPLLAGRERLHNCPRRRRDNHHPEHASIGRGRQLLAHRVRRARTDLPQEQPSPMHADSPNHSWARDTAVRMRRRESVASSNDVGVLGAIGIAAPRFSRLENQMLCRVIVADRRDPCRPSSRHGSHASRPPRTLALTTGDTSTRWQQLQHRLTLTPTSNGQRLAGTSSSTLTLTLNDATARWRQLQHRLAHTPSGTATRRLQLQHRHAHTPNGNKAPRVPATPGQAQSATDAPAHFQRHPD